MDADSVMTSVRRALCAALAVVALAALSGVGSPALAGQNCEPRKPGLDSMKRDLALATSVAGQLDDLASRDGTTVLLIARAGQDLGQYGLRYSHSRHRIPRRGGAGRSRRVARGLHKLNQCGSGQDGIYSQGLTKFFSDGLLLRNSFFFFFFFWGGGGGGGGGVFFFFFFFFFCVCVWFSLVLLGFCKMVRYKEKQE